MHQINQKGRRNIKNCGIKVDDFDENKNISQMDHFFWDHGLADKFEIISSDLMSKIMIYTVYRKDKFESFQKNIEVIAQL